MVCYALGQIVILNSLRAFVAKIWKLKGKIEILHRANGFVIVDFTSADDCNFVIRIGPWFPNDHFMVIRKWERGLELRKDLLRSLPIWIRLPFWMSNTPRRTRSGK